MSAFPLCGHIPKLTYYRHFVHREQFFQYESVQEEWLIFAVENGSFYYEIGNRRATASFGDLVFCPPGVVFRRVVISPVTLFVLRMNWEDDEGAPIPQAKLDKLPVGKVSLRNTERLVAGYTSLKRRGTADDRWSAIVRSHYLHHIWLLYCEEAESPGPAKAPVPEDPLVLQAARRIQEHAFEPISLRGIAEELGVSRMLLYKKFHDALGTTPIKYLTALRLEKAKQLLAETNLTLDQISECCGYQNGFYLSRVFKKNCGVTPMQYRAEHRL